MKYEVNDEIEVLVKGKVSYTDDNFVTLELGSEDEVTFYPRDLDYLDAKVTKPAVTFKVGQVVKWNSNPWDDDNSIYTVTPNGVFSHKTSREIKYDHKDITGDNFTLLAG